MPAPDLALAVDGPRFWDTVMRSGEIGPGKAGGLRRLALTDADKAMRDLFVTWCTEAGCTVTIDRIGNIFARRPGLDEHLAPVLMGSHLDTQVAGGKYDGIVGVLAGLEILRTLAVRGMHVDVHGETAHAGPTPMDRRRNALVGAAMLAVAVNEIGWTYHPTEGKATVARLVAWPNKAGILAE
jgi:acetylornithine deacetylase/succinyl-diaminopimelate desuccinylase-like protein